MRVRGEVAAGIDQLLAFVDATDGDTDLEPEPVEPNLSGFDACCRAEQEDAKADGADSEPEESDDDMDSGVADFDGYMEQCPRLFQHCDVRVD